MTKEEYNNLKRFDDSDLNNNNFYNYSVNDIFEIYNIDNNILYCRISNCINDLIFDLIECSNKGENVRLPIKKNSITHSEITNKIIERDWRLYHKNIKR